jgi:hypothetical protein
MCESAWCFRDEGVTGVDRQEDKNWQSHTSIAWTQHLEMTRLHVVSIELVRCRNYDECGWVGKIKIRYDQYGNHDEDDSRRQSRSACRIVFFSLNEVRVFATWNSFDHANLAVCQH